MSFAYIDKIRAILDLVEKEESIAINKSVDIISDAIMNHHAIFTFGASHAGILSEELFYRAGGLVIMNPIFGREIMLDTAPITNTSRMERLIGYGTILANKTPFKTGDVLIVHSVSGRNPVTIELALEAKKRGVHIICITNTSYSKDVSSRHSSGKKLFEISDIVIDNHGEKGDACVSIEGLTQKVSPSSTVVGASIVNSIVAEVTKNLVSKGMSHLPIFYSANIDGGDALNQSIYEEYKEQIHYCYK